MKRWLTFLLCAATLAGCGPMYRTEYRLTPPKDAQSRVCANRCAEDQGACQARMDDASEDTFRNCAVRAEADYSQCKLLEMVDQGAGNCQRSCCEREPDYDGCATAFRNCFRACGGTVDSQQVCTFNCP